MNDLLENAERHMKHCYAMTFRTSCTDIDFQKALHFYCQLNSYRDKMTEKEIAKLEKINETGKKLFGDVTWIHGVQILQ
jgi:hypothetical protein